MERARLGVRCCSGTDEGMPGAQRQCFQLRVLSGIPGERLDRFRCGADICCSTLPRHAADVPHALRLDSIRLPSFGLWHRPGCACTVLASWRWRLAAQIDPGLCPFRRIGNPACRQTERAMPLPLVSAAWPQFPGAVFVPALT